MTLHFGVRTIAVVIAAVAVAVLAGRWLMPLRADATVERLNSVSAESRRILGELPGDRDIYVQAYISPEVPEGYERQRQNLLRVLRRFDEIGGDRIRLSIHSTELFSPEAKEAEGRFSIEPQRVGAFAAGRAQSDEIFMGVAVTSAASEEVIPFVAPGDSVEYQLAHAIRVVARGSKPQIGILRSPLQMTGGFDFQARRMIQPWPIVEELRKQYDVVSVEPGMPVEDEVQVLIAPMPSHLTQEEMDALQAYILSGRPCLLVLDPMPVTNIQLAPNMPREQQQSMMMQPQQPPEQKGDIEAMLKAVGVQWDKGRIVWDGYNPIASIPEIPPEIVFVSPESGNPKAFNAEEVTTRGLEGVVVGLYPGGITHAPGSRLEFARLLETTGELSGEVDWGTVSRAIQMQMMGMPATYPHPATPGRYTLAARVTGKVPAADGTGGGKVNLIALADLDMIGPTVAGIERSPQLGIDVANSTFLLNCVDQLAGDEALVDLRNQRPRYRPLSRIEEQRRTFTEAMLTQQKEAEDKAEEELAKANERLQEQQASLEKREDMDEQTRAIMLATVQDVEQAKFDAAREAINARKDERIRRAREDMQLGVRKTENRVRLLALVLPPLPAVLIGLIVLVYQVVRERHGTPLTRAMRPSE